MRKITYHEAVQTDVNEILDHYEREGGPMLADRFFAELTDRIEVLAKDPERFPFYLTHRHWRRVKLRNFPHVILFRIHPDRVRIMVIKHVKRHPRFGMSRR